MEYPRRALIVERLLAAALLAAALGAAWAERGSTLAASVREGRPWLAWVSARERGREAPPALSLAVYEPTRRRLALIETPGELKLGGRRTLERAYREALKETGNRVVISGDDVAVDDRGATPIALLIHELATNSAKYGSLSVECGKTTISVERIEGAVTIQWAEHGGPTLNEAPAPTGFGSELVKLSVERQMGGKITYDRDPAGLRVSINLSADRLHR